MTILTALWLGLLFAGTITGVAIGSARATTISSNGVFHIQPFESVSLRTASGENHVIVIARSVGDVNDFTNGAGFHNSAAILPVVEFPDSEQFLWLASDKTLASFDGRRLPGVDTLDGVVMLQDVAKQVSGLDPIRERRTNCEFSAEACHGAVVTASNASESAGGISKPTAILLIVVGYLGLMRARGRPSQ